MGRYDRSKKNKNASETVETSGPNWFHMKKTPMTSQVEQEIKLFKLRSVMDPKQHFKKMKDSEPSKFFQIGSVIDNPIEKYSSSVTSRKDRKKDTIDLLLEDNEAKKYLKKKYLQIQCSKQNPRKFKFRSHSTMVGGKKNHRRR